MKWQYTVNDIIQKHWTTVKGLGLNTHELRHLNNISKCHTPALGGLAMRCKKCDHWQYQYHSCRNRHCPSCQGSKREEWIVRQQKYLLDVPYFHVVFTLPEELRPLCLYKSRWLYSLLFKASWETIQTLSNDHKYLGAHSGMTAVLHTWSQNLGLHPHLHCIVPGGGLTKSGKWKTTRSKGKYLFPTKVMAIIFRSIFMRELKLLNGSGGIKVDKHLRTILYNKKWVVYAKRPFLKPKYVIEYLGRYTHKIAISNYRIVRLTDMHVHFNWKDYRHAEKKKVMVLTIAEFLRRFSMHILPHRFVRIRHFGLLSFHGRSKKIKTLQIQQNCSPDLTPSVPKPKKEIIVCVECLSSELICTVLPKLKPRAP